MSTCPECGGVDRHFISCPVGRCISCRRYPAVIGPMCAPCWSAMWRERRAIVAERLARLGTGAQDSP